MIIKKENLSPEEKFTNDTPDRAPQQERPLLSRKNGAGGTEPVAEDALAGENNEAAEKRLPEAAQEVAAE